MSRIVYGRNNPCKFCGGQVITIYSNGKMEKKYCVKCRKDIDNKKLRPIGREEKLGFLLTRKKID